MKALDILATKEEKKRRVGLINTLYSLCHREYEVANHLFLT